MNSQLSTRSTVLPEAGTLHVSALDQRLMKAGYDSLPSGLAELGLGAIELSIDHTLELPPLGAGGAVEIAPTEGSGLRTYRARLYELGVQVSAVVLTWVLPSASWREQQEHALAALRAAEVIGTGVLRLSLRWEEEAEPTPAQAAEVSAGALEALLTDSADVVFAVEAPGLVQGQPEFHRHLVREIDSERVGLALDPGELYCAGLPLSGLYDLVREFSPRVRHVACRSFRRPAELRDEFVEPDEARQLYACPLEEGDIDYARIALMMGAVGYSGALTVNSDFRDGMEPKARQSMLRGDVAFLKDVLGQG